MKLDWRVKIQYKALLKQANINPARTNIGIVEQVRKLQEQQQLQQLRQQLKTPTQDRAPRDITYLQQSEQAYKQRSALQQKIKKSQEAYKERKLNHKLKKSQHAYKERKESFDNTVYMARVEFVADHNRDKTDDPKETRTPHEILAERKSLIHGEVKYLNKEFNKDGKKQFVYHFKGTKRQIQEASEYMCDNIDAMPYMGGSKTTKTSFFQTGEGSNIMTRTALNSYSLIKYIDIGDNKFAHTDAAPGLCVPQCAADCITAKGKVYSGSNQRSPKIDNLFLNEQLKQIRRDMPPFLEINNEIIECPKIPAETPGFTMLELYQLAVMNRCKHLYILAADRFSVLFKWINPDYGNKNIRLREGIQCVWTSHHVFNLNIVIEQGEKIESHLPEPARMDEWKGARSSTFDYSQWGRDNYQNDDVGIEDLIHDNKNIVYVLTDYDELFNNYLLLGYVPQLYIGGGFSLKGTLFKQVSKKDYDDTVRFCAKVGITYSGQSKIAVIYEYFKRVANESYLSPATYSVMTGFYNNEFADTSDGLFRYQFNCSFSDVGNRANLQAFDVRRSYTHAMSVMSIGQFMITDDPAPFNGKIIETGFYQININIGFPTHGAGTFIAGFLAQELIDDDKLTLKNITRQIVPTYKHKENCLKKSIELIHNEWGKDGANLLNGFISMKARDKQSHFFITTDYCEVLDASK
jgi:hypothetical protein